MPLARGKFVRADYDRGVVVFTMLNEAVGDEVAFEVSGALMDDIEWRGDTPETRATLREQFEHLRRAIEVIAERKFFAATEEARRPDVAFLLTPDDISHLW